MVNGGLWTLSKVKREPAIFQQKSYMKISVLGGDIQSFKVSKSTQDQVIRIQKIGDYPDVLMAGFVPFHPKVLYL